MAEAKPLRFLIIDGYTKEARDQLQSGGASLAADLYKKMLLKCSPVTTQCDIIFLLILMLICLQVKRFKIIMVLPGLDVVPVFIRENRM